MELNRTWMFARLYLPVLLVAAAIPSLALGQPYVYVGAWPGLLVIDDAANRVVDMIGLTDAASSVVIAPDSTRLYALSGGIISIVNLVDGVPNYTVNKALQVGNHATDLAVTPDGRHLFVTDSVSGDVSEVDTSTYAVEQVVHLASAGRIVLTPDGTGAVVLSGKNANSGLVQIIDTNTFQITQVSVPSTPQDVAITPDGARAVVSLPFGISIVNMGTLQVQTTDVGEVNGRLAISPDGRFAYVTTTDETSGSKVSTFDGTLVSNPGAGLGFRRAIAFVPGTNRVYVTSRDGVFSGDPGGNSSLRKTPLNYPPDPYYDVGIVAIAPFGRPHTYCQDPTVSRPSPTLFPFVAATGWKATAEVSDTDGLVLSDVMLKELTTETAYRYMAKQISVPYYEVKVGELPKYLGELKYDSDAQQGDSGGGRSRLVGFQQDAAGPSKNTAFVEATYAIDNIPNGSQNCLAIIQRYEFKRIVVNDACEPTATVPCVRFFPLISFNFHPDPALFRSDPSSAAWLNYVAIPQRFHFQPDGLVAEDMSKYAVAVIRDPDSLVEIARDGLTTADPLLFLHGNPMTVEVAADQITDGKGKLDLPFTYKEFPSSYFDNYHQTWQYAVDEPSLLAQTPGCPECIHMHWRWTQQAHGVGTFVDDNNGEPRIPVGSHQTVEVGVTVYRTGEEHPIEGGWESLVGPESLLGPDGTPSGQPVFWYQGSEGSEFLSNTFVQLQDTFFMHGLFFNPTVGSKSAFPNSPSARYVGDVTPLVEVTPFGSYATTTGKYKQLIKIRNLSKTDIPAPKVLVGILVEPVGSFILDESYDQCYSVTDRTNTLKPWQKDKVGGIAYVTLTSDHQIDLSSYQLRILAGTATTVDGTPFPATLLSQPCTPSSP